MNKVKTHYKNINAYKELAFFLKDYISENTVIICIGTDRCIGDCLGPLIGTMLKERALPLPIYGTIDEPIHALNLDRCLYEIKETYPDSIIIGIDACLGEYESIGEIQARDFPIHPGKGVGKVLPEVGNISLVGIVDSSDIEEIFTNRNIRLSLIMNMAKVISNALIYSYKLVKNLETSSNLDDI